MKSRSECAFPRRTQTGAEDFEPPITPAHLIHGVIHNAAEQLRLALCFLCAFARGIPVRFGVRVESSRPPNGSVFVIVWAALPKPQSRPDHRTPGTHDLNEIHRVGHALPAAMT